MKKIICISIILSQITLSSVKADNIDGDAVVNIKPALTIVEVSPLHFGNITLGHKGSDSITMGHNGNMSSTANMALFNGSRSTGQFAITGEPYSTVSIKFNDFSDLESFQNTIKLRAFTTPNRHPTLSENGTVIISIGAKLIINPHQASGTYQGGYPITIDYF